MNFKDETSKLNIELSKEMDDKFDLYYNDYF